MPAVPASSTTSTRAFVESAGFVAVDRDQQSGDRGRRDAGRHRQLVGGDAGVGGADHPVARSFPRSRAVANANVLPAPAGAVSTSTPLPDVVIWITARHLFLRQRSATVRSAASTSCLVAHRPLGFEEDVGGVEGVAFDVEQLERRPPLLGGSVEIVRPDASRITSPLPGTIP